AGWAIARWLERRVEVIPPREYRHAVREAVGRPAARAQEIRRRVEDGEFAETADAYFNLRSEETEGLLEPRDSLRFAAWLVVTGHPEAACVVYRRLLRDHPSGPAAAEAHLALGEILLQRL